MSLTWSAEARLLRAPFRTYRELGAEEAPAGRWWLLLRRPLLMLLCIGIFVSLTAAGRVVLWHLLFTFVFWSFGPVHQVLLVAGLTRLLARGQPIGRAVDLFFVGHGAWFLFLALLCGICLFASQVYETFVFLLTYGILPALLLAVILWSMVTTYAFFRAALSLSRGRALWATVGYYIGFFGLIFGYYAFTNQLQPVLFG